MFKFRINEPIEEIGGELVERIIKNISGRSLPFSWEDKHGTYIAINQKENLNIVDVMFMPRQETINIQLNLEEWQK